MFLLADEETMASGDEVTSPGSLSWKVVVAGFEAGACPTTTILSPNRREEKVKCRGLSSEHLKAAGDLPRHVWRSPPDHTSRKASSFHPSGSRGSVGKHPRGRRLGQDKESRSPDPRPQSLTTTPQTDGEANSVTPGRRGGSGQTW